MSIRIMSLVWDKSKHKGSALLLMLAIADHADDNGKCWPGMSSLAKKTRMGRRNVVKLMERIEASGEIIVEKRGNQSASNRYRVNVALLSSEQMNTSEPAFTSPSEPVDTTLVNQRSHESSLTKKKPSREKKETSKYNATEPTVKTNDIKTAFTSCVNYPINWAAGSGASAKWLAENGYTPDDVIGCYRSMASDPWWKDKEISLKNVANKIGAWKQTAAKRKVIHVNV